jgi:hypothetical protein
MRHAVRAFVGAGVAVLAVLGVVETTDHGEAAEFASIGTGAMSCGNWTSDRRDRQAIAEEQWILGFLSGIGAAPQSPGLPVNPLHGVDAQAVLAWIDNYCRGHPLDLIMTAGEAFVTAHPR